MRDALAPLDGLIRQEAPDVADEAILRVHPQSHLDAITGAAPASGIVQLDPDTFMSPGSLSAARRAAGAMVAAVDQVLTDQADRAFIAMRPPGHHAEKTTPMGFCLFGTVAIGAAHALAAHGLDRVAIVDFDVHHGNGTQDLIWDEERVLFISSHQMPLYPGTGAANETGAHGNVMNLPLPTGSDGAHMRRVYERDVLPALDAFAPQLILISAGFDAHARDPLAQLNWDESDYVWVTEALCALADKHCAGRVVSTLEGGYDLDALWASTAAHVKSLMGTTDD
ncbi:acetoin utilization deacetylase AcuC-like enzyme [Rubricella aquisinus]|uniref:Acetoin utilization deacetylase AcuC-like enzyme n=1 Tax=Rubricella aquisinus TaxID=2028108 RepID=A0A840WKA4_9RHOB|nr:acetoin utilization deacetylase AcuC-like enzyme [Rubricella aquisinus]